MLNYQGGKMTQLDLLGLDKKSMVDRRPSKNESSTMIERTDEEKIAISAKHKYKQKQKNNNLSNKTS